MTQALKDWQRDVGRFVSRPHLPDYAEKFAAFARLERRDGIVEVRLHSEGGPVTVREPEWYAVHNAWGQLWQEVGNDPDNEILIITGTGADWLRPHQVDARTQNERLQQVERPCGHAYEHTYYDAAKVLENLVFGVDIPTIATVNGPSAAHTEFALLCDVTLASETASSIRTSWSASSPVTGNS